MKTVLITLCLACLLILGGCSDDKNVTINNNGNNGAGNGDNGGNGGGGNTGDNLQTFVLNNCGGVTDGEPMAINGAMFPANDTEDPTQSIYTRNCLNQ